MEKWKTTYNPRDKIEEEWYLPLLREINTEELKQTINTLPNNKAPGQSNL
ncbi:13300_t:CDS:1, partial [Dentiscutata erythropus]